MAEVYRGTQRGAEGFSKTVAVKRVLPGYSNDPRFAEMFVAEATIASRLMHPNVVAVTDFDRDTAGRLFLVMELVEGRDLRALMTTGRLPPSIVVYVVSELLRALGYAHALHHDGRPMQIVHRDVSPHNVLVSWDGAVKLSDFGIAKAAEASPATRTGVVKGKAAYLSPEQARAESLDHRSDLFAAGVVLYELLTDRRLFAVPGGAREAVIIHRVLNLEYPSPREVHTDISEALDGVCRWLLARDRDQRPADAFEALDALLTCPEASARGARALAQIMRERFPREAPSLTTPAHSGPIYETPSKPPVGDFTDSEIDAREAAYNLRSVAVDPVAQLPTKTEPTPAASGAQGRGAAAPAPGGWAPGAATDRGGDARAPESRGLAPGSAGRGAYAPRERGLAPAAATDRKGQAPEDRSRAASADRGANAPGAADRRANAPGAAADRVGDARAPARRSPAPGAADRGGAAPDAADRGDAANRRANAPRAADDRVGDARAPARRSPAPGAADRGGAADRRGPAPGASADRGGDAPGPDVKSGAAAPRADEPAAHGHRAARFGGRAESTTTPVPAPRAAAAPESTAGGRRSDRISGPTAVRDAAPSSRWPGADTRSTAHGSLVPGTLVDAAPTRHTPAPSTSPPRRAWWAAFVALAAAAIGLGYLNWRPDGDERVDAAEHEAPRANDADRATPRDHPTAEPTSDEDRGSTTALERTASDGATEPAATHPRANDAASADSTARRRRAAGDEARDAVDASASEPTTATKRRTNEGASTTRGARRRRRVVTPAPPPPEPPPPTKPKKVGDDLLSPDL